MPRCRAFRRRFRCHRRTATRVLQVHRNFRRNRFRRITIRLAPNRSRRSCRHRWRGTVAYSEAR
ncbi:MAG: hypothetical protein K2W95_05220 [Candidatus Obscuribacterales bacterium]|nr:hypothetical protein [Candidatus Obscuribacterales bacterium]